MAWVDVGTIPVIVAAVFGARALALCSKAEAKDALRSLGEVTDVRHRFRFANSIAGYGGAICEA